MVVNLEAVLDAEVELTVRAIYRNKGAGLAPALRTMICRRGRRGSRGTWVGATSGNVLVHANVRILATVYRDRFLADRADWDSVMEK